MLKEKEIKKILLNQIKRIKHMEIPNKKKLKKEKIVIRL